ncbi:MAG: copper amine oxidase N-terminal domain-containing protein [Cellulosilyticum sp.]|nr:copper amine oxidase N-terminal domain-containing protein [Cellulosilyticum sp.]
MKLRNKLVAVMAASMVVTSVPVVTMADSSNTLSVYNYKIKNSTIGFTTSSYVYSGTTKATANYTDGALFKSENPNLPKLEISPEYTYDLSKQQTAFLHLTTDSNFVKEAYVAYVAALNNDGTTNVYFDEDGKLTDGTTAPIEWKIVKDGALDTVDVKGLKVNEIIDKGYLQIGYTGADSATVGKANEDSYVIIKPMDITEQTMVSGSDRKYKSTIRMDFNGKFAKGTTYAIPFLAKVGGDKEVLAYLDGNDSFVSTKTFSITGVLTDKKLAATADSKTITIDNIEEIGEIRLDETQIGSLKDANNRWIKIKLPSSSDLEFNLSKTTANIKATGKRGFYGKEAKYSTDTTGENVVNVVYGKETRTTRDTSTTVDDDQQVLLIQLPKWEDASAYGEVVLTGIHVQPQDKTAATGDVNITLSEDLTKGTGETAKNIASTNLVASTTLKVATVADYGVTIESEPVNVKAGRSGIVSDTRATFTLKEAVKDSLVDTRKIEFTLENGYIFGPADVDYSTTSYSTTSYAQAAKARFVELIEDEVIKFEEKAGKDGDKKGFLTDSLSLDIDANGYVIGFSGLYDRLTNTSDDKVKVTLPVATSVMAKGEIKVKAGNLFTRSYEKDVECVIANIIEPIAVEIENAAIKVGLQEQAAGKVTIKETDKGMIEKGWMFLSAEDLQDGITFDAVPDIKVTSGNMTIDHVQITRDNKVVAFEVTKTSTEASTIEVSNIKFTADRTVPEANYDLQIWGDALTDENVLDVLSTASTNVLYSNSYRNQYTDMYVVPEFITMTTKNTQDIDASGLKAATATFVLGESKFTVNGEAVTMDSAVYAKDGYTMVPVKYVAKAFGIEGNAIQYDKATSTATIIAGNKVISITAGKAAIVVNGTAIPMAVKAEVKDGRMCVPMAYIASALDVQKSWDATTKTATFTNQTEAK